MSWNERIEQSLKQLREQSRYRALDREPALSFSHNDYLGLSQNPRLRELALEKLACLPSGSGGSRLLGGNLEIFEILESEIARFFQAPSALFFSTGYLANLAVVTSLASFADHLFCDEKLHASLIDGVRLSGKPKTIVSHQKWESLTEQVAPFSEGTEKWLAIAETLYSMDGDAIQTEALLQWQKRTGAFLILDEAHACGVFDETGQGISASWRDWNSMAVVVTFGKAFGVAGAAVLCSEPVKQWLINGGRSFIYTTAPSPWTAALVLASLECMRKEGLALRQELWSRARQVRSCFRQHGLGNFAPPASNGPSLVPSSISHENSWDEASPIVPVLFPGNDRALRLAQVMRESGWGVKAVRYPTVPMGSERIRISLNLQVSAAATLEFAETFSKKAVELWKAFS